MTEAVDVVSDGSAAVAMLHPMRLRILAALSEPDSAAGLARRLGVPRQRLGYHLRQLETAGLVVFVEERRRGNCTERVVRASADAYVVDPGVLGPVAADPDRVSDRLSATFLVSVLARGVRELSRLRRLAAGKGKRLATLTIDTEIAFGSAAAQEEFAAELSSTINDLVARHHDETALRRRRFRLVVASYPVPKEDKE